MSLQIGEIAPDFAAQSTHGKISFYDWMGESWVVLLAYPREFTPACAAELRTIERLQPAFESRGCKIIGLGVDPVDDLDIWFADIEKSSGQAPVYPLVGSGDLRVAKLYDLIPQDDSEARTMRRMTVIGRDRRVKLVVAYPMVTDAIFDEILQMIASLQDTAPESGTKGLGLRSRSHREHQDDCPTFTSAAPERTDQGEDRDGTSKRQVC